MYPKVHSGSQNRLENSLAWVTIKIRREWQFNHQIFFKIQRGKPNNQNHLKNGMFSCLIISGKRKKIIATSYFFPAAARIPRVIPKLAVFYHVTVKDRAVATDPQTGRVNEQDPQTPTPHFIYR